MGRTVNIEVRLDGAEEAKKGLKGIGETAASMADRFDKSNSHMGEGLGALVGNIEEAGGAFKDLSHTMSSLSKGGKASLASLIPAIGGVIAVGFALYETFLNISGAAHEAELAEEALSASSADLQSKLEMLAEKGVKPTNEELAKFTRLTLKAQLAKEALENSSKAVSRSLSKEEELTKRLHEGYRRRRFEGFTKALDNLLTGIGYYDTSIEIIRKLQQQELKTQRLIREQNRAQAKSQEELLVAESMFLDLEARSATEIVRKLQEDIQRLKRLQLMEVEVADVSRLEKEKYKIELDGSHQRIALRLKESEIKSTLGDRDKDDLIALYKEIKDELSQFDEATLNAELIEQRHKEVNAKHLAEVRKRRSAEAAEEKARRASLLAAQKAAEAQRLLLERQAENEIFAIRALGIKSLKEQGADKLAVLMAQYSLERDRAHDNQNQLLMAEMRFEMAKTKLIKSEEAKRQAERDKRQAQIIKDIDERNSRERESIQIAGEITASFGSAFAEASYGALAMGESFNDAIVGIIHGLGKQAAVESLIQTAKGFASLAILDGPGAAAHFKAALGFAAGAAAAGVAANAIGGGSSGGGGGGGASPSGAPQTAPTPQRETAQETSTVFNINFGGSVIYDTKQAAERAMVDRIVGVMNQRNRGSRRLNLGRV